MKAVRTPYTPTASELADHRISHLPFRNWCPECVEAFGREAPHKSTTGTRATWVPVVSCDYLFVSTRGVFTREEWRPVNPEETHLKVLVVYDSKSRCLFAHAVPQKGIDESRYVIDAFATDIAWLGWSRVIIRSDNEPALVKLVIETLKTLKVNGLEQASAEGSVPYDPQSNGAAEAAVGILKGSLRTLILGLERQIGARVPVTHPIVTWLVRHAAMLRTLRVKGPDGLTAYQTIKGRTTSGPAIIGFGEKCRFKKRSKEPITEASSWRWSTGAWLGVDTRTGQYILYDGSEISFARTIMRVTDGE